MLNKLNHRNKITLLEIVVIVIISILFIPFKESGSQIESLESKKISKHNPTRVSLHRLEMDQGTRFAERTERQLQQSAERKLSRKKSQNIAYTIELNLSSMVEVELAKKAGLQNPRPGSQRIDVGELMLQNLRNEGLSFKIIGGISEVAIQNIRVHPQTNELATPFKTGDEYLSWDPDPDYLLPDLRGVWITWNLDTAPEGIKVTSVEYRLLVQEEDVGQSDFWCSDYVISLSSQRYGQDYDYYPVWDRDGRQTDNDEDDDPEDDYDIYLDHRTTSRFNGEDANQEWYAFVGDFGWGDEGEINYIEIWIHWGTLPDLIADNYDRSAETINEGENFWFKVTIKNEGNVAANPSHIKLFLSTDNDGDVSDDFEVSPKKSVPSLSPNGYADIQWDFAFPDLSSGNYDVWPILIVDCDQEVDEVSESNNIYRPPDPIFVHDVAGEPDIDIQPIALTINQTQLNGSITHFHQDINQIPPEELPVIGPIDSKYITRTFIGADGREIVEIIVPGKPPDNYRAPVAKIMLSAITLPGMPAYDWSFGCSTTSAAMMAGYFDNAGYPDMYTGPTNGGIMPLDNSVWGDVIINGETRHQCPLSATRNGIDGRTISGHVDDYWINYGDPGPDPYITNGWIEHIPGECTGDFMGTNQSYWDNSDGATTFFFNADGLPLYDYRDCENEFPPHKDGCHGMRLFFESRGYTVVQNYSQFIRGYDGNTIGFRFSQFKQEIDAGRPVMIQVEGHSMVGYGYDDNGNTVYIRDTWDHQDHTMTWGGSYNGLKHYAVAVVELEPVDEAIYYFTIYNVGSAMLTINSITNDRNWLTTSSYPPVPFDIQPGDSQKFAVTVNWNLLNTPDQCNVAINSNDPDEQTVTVIVTANPIGQVPELSVTPESYHAPSAGGSAIVTVTNSGSGGTFTWNAETDRNWIIVSPASGNPGHTFTITVQPNSNSTRSGTVTVSAPGANGSPKYIPVTQDGDSNLVNLWIDPDLSGYTGGAVVIPINASDVTGLAIYSADLTISFDENVLEATGVDISGTIIETSDWNEPVYDIKNGKIVLALAESSPLTGSGVFIKIIGTVKGNEGDSTKLHFDNAVFNEGDPPLLTRDGLLKVRGIGVAINGQLVYFNDSAVPVKEATVQLTGNATQDFISDDNGNYEFINLFTGNYIVTPGKHDTAKSTKITSFDASLILRYSVGMISLNPYQKIAGDVSGNGEVTSYDASLILRYSVDLIKGFPAGDWTFVPHNYAIEDTNWSSAPRFRSYTPLTSPQTDQDFVGILLGDVSGNYSGGSFSSPSSIVELGIDNFKLMNKGKLLLPLVMKFTGDVYSGNFKLSPKKPGLRLVTISLDGSPTDDLLLIANGSMDEINIAFASSQSLDNQQIKINLLFDGSSSGTSYEANFDFVDIVLDDNANITTLVKDIAEIDLPTKWHLSQNHPNPFNAETIISYQVPVASPVEIKIFNLMGQHLRTVVNENKNPGVYKITWNGRDDQDRSVGSGIYIYKMRAGEFTAMKKMVLVQ